jgi:hypothetical protein
MANALLASLHALGMDATAFGDSSGVLDLNAVQAPATVAAEA